jgi:hypothetical protein
MKEQPTINPFLYMPSTTNLYDNGAIQKQIPPPQIIKNYNINVPYPDSNHIKVNKIIEDILPSGQFNITFETLYERNELYNFMVNTLFFRKEGEKIGISNTVNSILSHVKFLELNPFNTYKFSKNPYLGLPDKTLVYKSCYPIKHNRIDNYVSCSSRSIAINIRITGLSNSEYSTYIKDGNIKKYNIFRQLNYYNYIRECILNKLICPNFIGIFGFYITDNTNINFMKLDSIILSKNNYNFSNLLNYFDKDELLDRYSKNALIMLTESPNYNFNNWASKVYMLNGNIKKMTNTGYYSENVWYSILFQLFIIVYILYKHKTIINNFNIEDNIYIKDIGYDGDHSKYIKYWRYKINGIEYIVPNYGYLVLFDNNQHINKKHEYNIESYEIFGDDVQFKIYDSTKYMLNNIFNTNIFNNYFKQNGGVVPSDKVLKFINNINNDINTDGLNIEKYIIRNFGMYMNKKIGTYVNESNIKDIDLFGLMGKNFKRGNMVVHDTDKYNMYKYGLFIDICEDDGTLVNIITKDNNDINIMIKIIITSVYYMKNIDDMEYDPEKTTKLEHNIIESYII